jgi:integrase/recombinase XerD
VRDRLRSFLRYRYEGEGLTGVPQVSKIQVDQAPTLPLRDAEYDTLLDTTYATFADEPERGPRVRALIQLMRHSGLAIRDALTLKSEEIVHDKATVTQTLGTV